MVEQWWACSTRIKLNNLVKSEKLFAKGGLNKSMINSISYLLHTIQIKKLNFESAIFFLLFKINFYLFQN